VLVYPFFSFIVLVCFISNSQEMDWEERLRNYLFNVELDIQEGLAVASIAQDDLSTLPGDDPFPRTH